MSVPPAEPAALLLLLSPMESVICGFDFPMLQFLQVCAAPSYCLGEMKEGMGARKHGCLLIPPSRSW